MSIGGCRLKSRSRSTIISEKENVLNTKEAQKWKN